LKRKAFYTNIHFLFITGGLVLNFLLAVVYSYINQGSPFFPLKELEGFYTQGWPIMLQTFVILYLMYYTIRYFNKKYSYNPNGFERFLRELLFVSVIGFCIMETFRSLFITYMVVPEDDMDFLERKLKMILTIDMAFLIVVYASMTSFRIFRYLQLKNIEVARWQREYTQSQFEAVKNQLNPHFLFNSLNALSSLVYVDANLSEKFIEKLSRSYRYLLEQRDKQSVPLEQEMDFLHAFLFLLEQRFGRKLQVTVEKIDTSNCWVPPHTLLIVLEQILQNNTMSTAKPLRIFLTREGASLCIRYSQQRKTGVVENSPQFDYLQQQFRFLNEREITSMVTDGTAAVTIPLHTT
jgi:two-component system, LytTR family, sensor kinase